MSAGVDRTYSMQRRNFWGGERTRMEAGVGEEFTKVGWFTEIGRGGGEVTEIH